MCSCRRARPGRVPPEGSGTSQYPDSCSPTTPSPRSDRKARPAAPCVRAARRRSAGAARSPMSPSIVVRSTNNRCCTTLRKRHPVTLGHCDVDRLRAADRAHLCEPRRRIEQGTHDRDRVREHLDTTHACDGITESPRRPARAQKSSRTGCGFQLSARRAKRLSRLNFLSWRADQFVVIEAHKLLDFNPRLGNKVGDDRPCTSE